MTIQDSVQFSPVDNLFLDPKNPRLGRKTIKSGPTQEEILEWMKSYGVLEELAVSFLESGFWTQEAVVVVSERLGRRNQLVVVEGNRRLAALKMLWAAYSGAPVSKRWEDIAASADSSQMKRLANVPYVIASTRKEVQAYLGFRHVSGIKEWNPAEKAEFIAQLIDEERLSYVQVMRRIGSKTNTVRQNYISYRILLQMENQDDEISIERVESRFSVLYLSLRTTGVQKYLDIDIMAEPAKAVRPVPRGRLKELANFALWLFGSDAIDPIVTDSRQTDKFGEILESDEAVKYLERSRSPSFQSAYRLAGGEEVETTQHIEAAADEIEEALGTVHHFKKSRRLQNAVSRLAVDVRQLLEIFPKIRDESFAEE